MLDGRERKRRRYRRRERLRRRGRSFMEEGKRRERSLKQKRDTK